MDVSQVLYSHLKTKMRQSGILVKKFNGVKDYDYSSPAAYRL